LNALKNGGAAGKQCAPTVPGPVTRPRLLASHFPSHGFKTKFIARKKCMVKVYGTMAAQAEARKHSTPDITNQVYLFKIIPVYITFCLEAC
jgi:hypothetical protein